ncbi:MAG: hypothetical protein ACM31E_09535 [Fibrobacterota bacterium]
MMNSQIIENLKTEIARLESELVIKRAELATLVSESISHSDREPPSKISGRPLIITIESGCCGSSRCTENEE